MVGGLTREEKIAATDRIIRALYELAEKSAAGGLRQTSVDGMTLIYRNHAEVLSAIKRYEKHKFWLNNTGSVVALESASGAAGNPEGSRSQ